MNQCHSVISQEQRVQSPVKPRKEWQGEPVLQRSPLTPGLHLYPFQMSRVLSSICSSKTSIPFPQAASRKTPCVCFQQSISHLPKQMLKKIVFKMGTVEQGHKS